jgi:uncharacterized protein (DUF433 family)
MNKKLKIASVGMFALAAASMAIPSVYAQASTAVKTTTNKMAGVHRGPFDQTKMLEEQADVLGITVDDLQSRMDAGQSFQDIVKELGISEDAIRANMEAQRTERVAEMKVKIAQEVTDGKITQEQADKKIAEFESGKGGPRGEGKGLGLGLGMGQIDDSKMLEEKATILGITVDDLKARLESGKSMKDIETDLGISQETMQAKMEENRTARETEMKVKIAQEVTDGKITQEQADEMLERLTNPSKQGFGRGMGKGEPRGNMGPHGSQDDSSSTSASQQ